MLKIASVIKQIGSITRVFIRRQPVCGRVRRGYIVSICEDAFSHCFDFKAVNKKCWQFCLM